MNLQDVAMKLAAWRYWCTLTAIRQPDPWRRMSVYLRLVPDFQRPIQEALDDLDPMEDPVLFQAMEETLAQMGDISWAEREAVEVHGTWDGGDF